MHIKIADYPELARSIIANNSRVYIYGAGMIGQIVMPYLIDTYRLHDYLECFIDMDIRKMGNKVVIGESEYIIKSPDALENALGSIVILVTNSRFYSVIDFLEQMDSLKEADCYIIPMLQKLEQRKPIPKTIHYCWFGGRDMPAFLLRCIESWREYCPDYEIIRWDESNYDIDKHPYTKQAAEMKRYGFITDVARLDILYQYGGIYLDTDVRLLRSLDGFLFNKGFVGVERWGNINSGGGIGAIPQHPMIKEMLDYRLAFPFLYEDGTLNTESNGFYETKPFIRHGMRIDNTLQIVNDMTVYPASVFHPYDYMSCEERIEADTVSVHYFYGGWMDDSYRSSQIETQRKYQEILSRVEE